MSFANLYVDIAELFHLAGLEPYNAPDVHYPAAQNAIVDLTSVDSLVAVELLYPMNDLIRNSRQDISVDAYVTAFIKKINGYVIRNVTSNLDSFINGLSWTLGAVPEVWKDECEKAQYDTSNWV